MATDGTVFDEARLLEKLRAIEALFAGASTEGERVAAAEAPTETAPVHQLGSGAKGEQ